MKRIFKNIPFNAEYTILALFLLGLFIVLTYKLISNPTPFIDWDESIYMQVGKEMIAARSAVPLWLGQPWLEKPPLVPFVYALVALLPMRPEISTRIFSLILALLALILMYIWTKRTLISSNIHPTNAKLFAYTVIVILAFNPTFVRRAQEVNTDVWLLIGWLGYLLTYPKFKWSLAFLFIGVFSKSLLGLYPICVMGLYEVYLFLTKKNNHLAKNLIFFSKQVAIVAIWYILMFAIYGTTFLEVHFIDHLVRRVTQSIESHFGKRTFYIDLIVEQFGKATILMLSGIALSTYLWLKKKISTNTLKNVLFFVPFFLFLNLTKTKIAWYLYPAIPGAVFLMVYPFTLIKNRLLLTVGTLLCISVTIYNGFFTNNLMTTFYSSENSHYQVAIAAKRECNSLHMLLDGNTRKMFATLDELNLLISTSLIYNNNPAMIYYYEKPVDFSLDVAQTQRAVLQSKKGSCFAIEKEDLLATNSIQNLKRIGKMESIILLRREN